jgi:hypothetical protein
MNRRSRALLRFLHLNSNCAFEGLGRFNLETGKGFDRLSFYFRGLAEQKIIGDEVEGPAGAKFA